MYKTRGIEVRKKYKVELRWKIAKMQEKRERIIKETKMMLKEECNKKVKNLENKLNELKRFMIEQSEE